MSEKRKNLSAGDVRAAIKASLDYEREVKRKRVQAVFEAIMDKIDAGDYTVKGGDSMLVSVRKSLVDPVWTDLIAIGKENKMDISYGYNEGFWFWSTTVIQITAWV